MAIIDKPSDYFNTVLYTGNGSTQSITGVNFQPDFVWTKRRDSADWHVLNDSVRGANKQLFSNLTNAEGTETNILTSFNSDGFSLGVNGVINASSGTFASWNWKAGGTASSNTDGSITSSVSANQDAGFSIVSYTGNGSNGASFGHGLGVKPKIVLIKNRTTAKNWVYWQDTTNNGTSDVRLCLNLTNANFNNFHVTFGTSTITLGDTDDAWNKSGDNLIAYCFAEKQGFSKFSSYVGNGSSDGSYIHLGFKPAWFLVKQTNESRSWYIWDNKRDSDGNPMEEFLSPNNSNAESGSGNDYADFTSNGIKMRENNAGFNKSGGSYIYMAFAENPFVSSTGVPATAR